MYTHMSIYTNVLVALFNQIDTETTVGQMINNNICCYFQSC